ncbi:unnamed protein product [Caenorhabditis sp. 36 PRJEB53466]|nr:unnamed protein product [Caenorhabditis sp. 36 PRJEB53466]
MREGQVDSMELAKALDEVKNAGSERKESSFRFYAFLASLLAIVAYLVALMNRESVCNLLRTSDTDYYAAN